MNVFILALNNFWISWHTLMNSTVIEAVHFTLINVILYLKYLAIPHLDFKMVRIIKIISYLNHHLQVSMSHHRSE